MHKRSLYSAWAGDPPRLDIIALPMPDAPYLPLTGGGSARISLDSFLNQIERDFQSQQGHFFEYVWESDKDEADTYILESWDVCRPESGIHEAIILLYYAPMNPYLTLQKHFGQDLANQYLNSIPAELHREFI